MVACDFYKRVFGQVPIIKEELLAHYRDLGPRVMTDYSYQGERLDLPMDGLMHRQAMQDIYTAFGSKITE